MAVTQKFRPDVISAFHDKGFAAPVIGVTGGKGGVGKTTVAVNLACVLADTGHRVALVDADVDAPNAAILLGLPLEEPSKVTATVPVIDESACSSCGECITACRPNALFLPKGKAPLLLGECNGCEACIIACPENAIGRGERVVGRTYKTVRGGMTLYTGELVPSVEESSLVVNALKRRVFGEAGGFDIILVDTSPGTHCNVINALKGADGALAVTEPTPLGLHDLELILRLFDIFEIKGSVVLNRSDLPGDKDSIFSAAKRHNSEVSAEIEMDELLVRSYVEGVPVVRLHPYATSSISIRRLADELAKRHLA